MKKILNQDQINKIVKRIAYQIHEKNSNESHIFLIGIKKNGYTLANLINKELELISQSFIKLNYLIINKKNPLDIIDSNFELDEMKNKSIVLIDDVLNSGKTLLYGVKFLLDIPLSNFNTVVLIDRNHNRFPIKADCVGLSLATTLQEYVTVVLDEDWEGVYLS